MNYVALFNQPRLRLALLYSGVIGSILLLLGYIAHRTMNVVFDRIIDREITLLAATVTDKLQPILAAPGQLTPQAHRSLVGLCVLNQPCNPTIQDAVLRESLAADYHFQLLDLRGAPIAAIAESPDRRSIAPDLPPSYTTTNPQGHPYHVHVIRLNTSRGEAWGNLQISRSLQQLDDYMMNLHLLIFLGVPFAMILIGGASWWLSGIAMRPLYQSYAQMQQFTANAAHELRTPIAAMKAMLEVAPTEAAAAQQQTLRSLQRQNDRLGKLAQDLLLLSRLDGTTTSQREVIGLHDLVQDLEEELAPLALAAKVKLSSEVDSAPPLLINGQTDQIYRLVSNLIINAINYTPENGTIVIRLDRKQNQVIITIEDNGIGIAAKDLPHLFERFYRVNHDRSRQTGGVGLGLAIAQAIAKSHGGQIQVQSQLGQGTVFTVRLPLKLTA
jgi:signal transduction histidine kinase